MHPNHSCCQHRQYKHIAWRQTKNQSSWIVQHQGRTFGGFHSSQDEAAGTLLKALGLKRKQELRIIGTRASKQRSTFRGRATTTATIRLLYKA